MAVMDWSTRRALSFRVSNARDACFCTNTLTGTLESDGRPEILNTDQGSQFTSLVLTSVVKDSGVAISIDRTGRCMGNIFTVRLWRPLEYEAVYLLSSRTAFRPRR